MQLRYKKITVKIGSNVLTKPDGMLNIAQIAHLVDQIAYLRKRGVEVVLVSSGAVAAGRASVKLKKKIDTVSQRQLWSALGQVKLINRYADFFGEHGLVCAQVLTAKENFSDRMHYLNMKNCFTTLLEHDVVPIVNENDTISVTELMFTDNDELSGLIASIVDSEALILLTNVDGVYSDHPKNKDAELIERIELDDTKSEEGISTERSDFGRGGMLTKHRIARKVASSGVGVHIANGMTKNVLIDLMNIESDFKHTYFVPNPKTTSSVKKWIAYSDDFAKGEVVVNKGASAALCSDKAVSLLPSGIVKVIAKFKKDDLIRIVDEQAKVIGIGRASYSSDKIEIEKLSEKQKPTIHYDYLYIEE